MRRDVPKHPIGVIADHVGQYWINLHCACGHHHKFDPADLADRWGAGLTMRRLVEQATCTICGQRKARLTIHAGSDISGRDRPRQVHGGT
jgi:hypothetical protein